MKIFAAPLQGFTESPWRRAHAACAGGVDEYFAPFSRVEKGAVRRRDIRDYQADADAIELTPQAIFRDVAELEMIADTLAGAGALRIDLNLGCPFPPQLHKGRGAAMIERPEMLRRVGELINRRPEISFSAKMRLGVSDPCRWREALPIINDWPLRHLTVHPRTASQQYAGELYFNEFEDVVELSCHPIVFNGDIVSPQQIDSILARYQSIAGVMIGRGLLADPLLAANWRTGTASDPEKRILTLLEIHDRILEYYRASLCGDHQVLQKIRPFWTYAADLLPHRIVKAIRKASSLAAYVAAIDTLR